MSAWKCTACTLLHEGAHAQLEECLICGEAAPPPTAQGKSPAPAVEVETPWECTYCTYVCKPMTLACGMCGSEKVAVVAVGGRGGSGGGGLCQAGDVEEEAGPPPSKKSKHRATTQPPQSNQEEVTQNQSSPLLNSAPPAGPGARGAAAAAVGAPGAASVATAPPAAVQASGSGIPAGPGGSAVRPFLIFMLIDEGDEELVAFKEQCHQSCDSAVHDHCCQRPGTQHLSLHAESMTDAQAAQVAFAGPAPGRQMMGLTLKDWPGCLGLGVDKASCARLNATLAGLKGCNKRVSVADPHISLYRGRPQKGCNWANRLKKEIVTMKRAVAGMPIGCCSGVRIAMKVMGDEYDNCRILA